MVGFFSRQSGLLPLLLMMTAKSVSAEKQPHCSIKEAPDGTCEELQEDSTNLLQTHATLNNLHGVHGTMTQAMGQADNKVIGKADDKALGQADRRADDEAAAVDEEEEKDNPSVPGSVLQTKDTYVHEELESAKATKKRSKKGPKLMTFINEHVKRSCQRPSEVISLLEYNNLRGQIEEELRRHSDSDSGKIPEHCQSFQTVSQDSQQNKDENNEDWKPKYDLLLQCCEAWEKQKLEDEVETYGVDVVGPSGVVYDYLKACSEECNDLKDGCTGFVDDHSARNLLNPRECLLVEEEEGEQLASLQDDLTGDQAPGPMLDFWKRQPSQPQPAAELFEARWNSFSSKGSKQNCKKITHKDAKKQKKLIKQCKAAKNRR